MSVEELYAEIRSTIEYEGFEIPSGADDMLADACRLIIPE